jgi:hypothetical protein
MARSYSDVRPDVLHRMIHARGVLAERYPLTLDEEATLGAVDVAQATRALGGTVDDAIELVRRMWASAEAVSS